MICKGCPYPVGHRFTIHGTEWLAPRVISLEDARREEDDGWTVTYHAHDTQEQNLD